MYLDPKAQSSSSNGARPYKACFIIDGELVKSIEVNMGNPLFNNEDKGHILEVSEDNNKLIEQALTEKNRFIISKALSNHPHNLHARQLKADAADAEAIFHVATDGVEEPKVKTKEEHKQPQSHQNDVNRHMNNLNPNAEEVAPDMLLKVLGDITFGYTANFDPIANEEKEGYDFPNTLTNSQSAQLTLFGRPFLRIEPIVKELGEMIRRGEENEIENVLSQVRKYPALLDVKVTTYGPQNIELKDKNLIEIAFMEGDVDLKEEITHENEQGLVERLAAAGELSEERVAEDSKCVTSTEAIKENKERIKRYVDIMIKFGNSICDGQMKVDAITQLEENLFEERKSHPVSAGLVFDPGILQQTAQWFEKNADKRFGGWWSNKSDIFWVNGFGKLQSMLSTRDAQVVRAGIATLVDKGAVPQRTLKNFDNSSYFYNSNSRLGSDFYLGIYGACYGASSLLDLMRAQRDAKAYPLLSNLMSSKNSSIAKLCNVQAIRTNVPA